MLEYLSWFLIGVVYYFANIYIVTNLLNRKINRKKINVFLLGLLVSAINIYFIVNLNSGIKMLVNVLFNVIALKYLFDENNSKILINTLFLYIGYAISEILFTVFFVYVLGVKLDYWKNNLFGVLIVNFFVVLITILFFKNKKVKNSVNQIVSWYLTKSLLNDIIVIILVMSSLLFFIDKNYNGLVYNDGFIPMTLFFFTMVSAVVIYFKEKAGNNKLTSEYDQLLDYVKTYEEVIEEKSKNQHEYNNQLILIREMLGNKNKKVQKYIDNQLKSDEKIENYNWLDKLKNIPNGGLKGLIHYKINEIIKNNINIYIDINSNVNTKKINKYLNNNLEDISKILGVYLDNAIEAAKENNKKYIIFEAETINNQLIMSISNTYKGSINYNKIDMTGYSKKGKGRGYGLTLVKDIINNHNDIDQYREFNGIYFAQKIKFKLDEKIS